MLGQAAPRPVIPAAEPGESPASEPAEPGEGLQGPATQEQRQTRCYWRACRGLRQLRGPLAHLLQLLRLQLLPPPPPLLPLLPLLPLRLLPLLPLRLLPWLRLRLCLRWRVSIEHVGHLAAQTRVHGKSAANGEEVGHRHRRVHCTVIECCQHRYDCARRIRSLAAHAFHQYPCTPCAAGG